MSRQNVNPNFKFGDTDGFMLTDIDTDESLMLIPCDTAGNFSWTGVTRAPLERNAMQTSNTSNQYSDLQRPWISIPQENWTGGRGNAIFTKDTTRYYDGKRCQAAFNEVIYNAPLDHYSDGCINRAVSSDCTGSMHWVKVFGQNRHIVREFQVKAGDVIGEIYIHFKRRGTPENSLNVDLCSGSLSSLTVIERHRFTTSAITDTLAEFRKFTLQSPISILENQTLYIRVFSSNGTTEDHWEVGVKNTELPSTYCSSKLSDGYFSLATYDLYYRVAAPQNDRSARFFTYEQLQFAVRHATGSNGASTIIMNGEIGKVSSYSGAVITDSSKNWEVDQWAGAKIGIVYKNGSQEHVNCWRRIISNTSNTLTLSSAFGVSLSTNTVYIINYTPLWQEIADSGLTGHVSDVHVINGVVYFAQGDYKPMIKMRWNNGAFEFMELTGCNASHVQSVRDSSAMMLYRARNDGINGKRTVERSVLLDWETSATAWTTIVDAVTTEDDATQVVHEESSVTDKVTGNNSETDTEKTTTTTVGGVDVTKVTVVIDGDVTETTSGGTTTTVTTNDVTTTTEILAHNPLRTSAVTGYKDFTSCDYDSKLYEITIGAFASENNSGGCVITLQQSEDHLAWHNVQSVTATGTGKWYIHAHCTMRYRRFMVTATGTNCTVNNIEITTTQIPHWEDPVILQDNYGKITRLFEYGAEQYKSLWIVQEGMLSSINKVANAVDTYTHDRINIDELQTTAEQWNGKAMTSVDVYLAWGWLNGLQRYYNTQLEGKGPDHDEGLPFNRQGRVSQIIAYPSNFFISIDAGSNGYSCVMQFNQSGWHEIYRAPNPGERIRDLAFQPIYGSEPDRLWMVVGDDIVWLSMPSKILYAIQDQYAEYTHESVLVSAWHTAGMTDIEKLWQTLKIMADYLDGENCWIEADYQTDEEEEWHPIERWYTVSPSQKEDLNPYGSVNGKKLRYRLRLQTTDIHKTPKVNVVVLEAVGRVDIKMSYNFYFRNIKYKRDLTAEFEDLEPLDMQEVLDEWANKLKKLRLNSRWKIFDNKLVYLDAVQTSVLNELSEGYIGQITLNEL